MGYAIVAGIGLAIVVLLLAHGRSRDETTNDVVVKPAAEPIVEPIIRFETPAAPVMPRTTTPVRRLPSPTLAAKIDEYVTTALAETETSALAPASSSSSMFDDVLDLSRPVDEDALTNLSTSSYDALVEEAMRAQMERVAALAEPIDPPRTRVARGSTPMPFITSDKTDDSVDVDIDFETDDVVEWLGQNAQWRSS